MVRTAQLLLVLPPQQAHLLFPRKNTRPPYSPQSMARHRHIFMPSGQHKMEARLHANKVVMDGIPTARVDALSYKEA